MENQLEQLKKMTTVVADTGDFRSLAVYTPQDTTTNPSLLLQSAQKPEYQDLLDEAISKASTSPLSQKERITSVIEHLFVLFGKKILEIIPGRVSIEIDPRLSFSTEKSLEKARHIIQLFEDLGIDRSRILIKLASSWDSIQAAKQLEKENIHCNMTLLFSLAQAIACAEAHVTLISPFVGRILDWHKKAQNKDSFLPHEDPGVISVTTIFHYYKKFGYKTQIMGASFRNVEEILELAGCDLLTIAPKFLDLLMQKTDSITKKLDAKASKALPVEKISMNKDLFHSLLQQDKMAYEKFHEGIELFTKDLVKLEDFVSKKLLVPNHLSASFGLEAARQNLLNCI